VPALGFDAHDLDVHAWSLAGILFFEAEADVEVAYVFVDLHARTTYRVSTVALTSDVV
jgi:hypothetical protein